jgi:hypothetical protein
MRASNDVRSMHYLGSYIIEDATLDYKEIEKQKSLA